eukprot:gene10328-11400_t
MPSTIDDIREAVQRKEKTPKEMLEAMYCSLGDVHHVDRLDKLPRGPKDIYNARCSQKQKHREVESGAQVNPACDDLWMPLEHAKREEEQTQGSAIIRECKIHPDVFLVLASDTQRKDIAQFCSNPKEFAVVSFDLTFNVFNKNISLTVMSY